MVNAHAYMAAAVVAYTRLRTCIQNRIKPTCLTAQRTAGVDEDEPSKDQLRTLHKLIAKVTDDTDELRFNTAIAAMMEFMNAATKWQNRPRAALEPFILLLAPYAPHIAEELWAKCGHDTTLAYASWPCYDPALLVEDEITLPVQVRTLPRYLTADRPHE